MNFLSAKKKVGFFLITSFVLILILSFKYSPPALIAQQIIFFVLGFGVFFYNRSVYPSYLIFSVIVESGIQANYLGANPSYVVVFVFLILVLSLFYIHINIKALLRKTPIYLLLFFIYSLIEGYSTIVDSKQLYDFALFWKMILSAIFLLYLIYISETVFLIEDTIVFASTVVAIYILILSFMGINIALIESRESILGQLPDRNYVSLLISSGFVLGFHRLLNKSGNTRLNLLIVFIIFAAQISVASRGGIIVSAISSLYLISNQNGFKNKIKYTIIVFLVSCAIIIFQENSTLFNRFKDTDSVDNMSGRTTIWEDSYTNFKNQDITKIYFGGGYRHGVENLANKKSIHNNYLETLYDYGIIGLSLLVFVFFNAYRKGDIKQRSLIIATSIGCITLTPWMSLAFWLNISYFTIKKNK